MNTHIPKQSRIDATKGSIIGYATLEASNYDITVPELCKILREIADTLEK